MKKYGLGCLILVISVTAFSQIDPVNQSGVAIGRYDVVAYFNAGKAVIGVPQFTSQQNAVTYYFSSKANQELFEAEPQKYIPQYEGYCALAVSYGKKISIDPETFKIIDGKLYLFFNGKTTRGHVNTIGTWNKNEPKLLKKADQLWPDVKRIAYKPVSAP